MKIAMISRATLYTSPGGDTKQIDETAAELRALGARVDIFTADQAVPYDEYELLHFFNAIRPADIIRHVKRSRLPFVLSTIFVEYGGVNESGRGGLVGALKRALPAGAFEYVKTVARAIRNGERIVSPEYLWLGHERSIRWVAGHAACLLPNSESEYRRFVARFPVATPHRVVPNGINLTSIGREYPVDERYAGAVISMGRIESRKNQLGLIRAMNGAEVPLYIHGTASPNNRDYYDVCVAEAAANVHIKGHLAETELYTAYANAKVHVLPSYFETTGLSSLEAAAMGCNVVVSPGGDTRDYFGDDAWYCDPDSVESIRTAVDMALAAPFRTELRDRILAEYTWPKAAEATLAAYREVLGQS
ncbi:MAG TPA: glycosyltransferase family 4 protein [Candidatus Lumbricidophila sp.]|nr:glycosyltransferase family 4 protein [Candidatus Lumbricidophila sp.]